MKLSFSINFNLILLTGYLKDHKYLMTLPILVAITLASYLLPSLWVLRILTTEDLENQSAGPKIVVDALEEIKDDPPVKVTFTEDKTYELLQEFKCPVCYSTMTPPKQIYQCILGHALCSSCQSKGLELCPTCREPIIGRAHNLEHISDVLFRF